jgi:beta-carotene 15,15'-dioxygenase
MDWSGVPVQNGEAQLRPALLLVPWVSMAALLAAWFLFPAALTQMMYLPLLLSVVLFGLPHGALDHQVPRLLGWRWAQSLPNLALYLLLYAALVAVLLMTWRVAPLLAFWGFLAASLLHWGQGDLHFSEAVLGRARSGWWSAPLAVLARGSLPILLPLLAFPEWFTSLARGAARAFGSSLLSAELLPGRWTVVLTGLLLAVLLGYVTDTLRVSPQPLLELGESGLLALLFLTVPPPLAIGLYFTLWHAWRHLGRLLALFTPATALFPPAATLFPPAAGLRPASLTALKRPVLSGRFLLELLPITLLALLLLGGVFLWAAPRVHDTQTFVALYLALIAALTGPHALLVALMDFPARPE